ncbi:hypothetical protein ACWDCB_40295 [Streptomyces sp. NPDC001178]
MFVGIDVEAGIAVAGGTDGARPPESLPAGVGEYLRRAPEPVEGLVLALPEKLFDAAGAAPREALYGELADGLGLRQFVPGSVAATASVERPLGRYLVCRLDAETAGAALCRATGREVELLGAEWRTTSADPQTVLVGDGVPSWETGRAALLLARARVQPRYRAAPLSPAGHVTAGAALDGFAPVEAALRSAVLAIRARHGQPAEDGGLQILVHGRLGGHPLAQDAVREATGGAPALVLEPHATALGALRLARGSVRAPAAAQYAVGLSVHRIRGGLLVGADIALTVEGQAVPLTVMDHDRAVTVDVPGAHRPEMWVRAGGREFEVPCPALRGGRYRLGMHSAADGLGVLVFRPDDAGEPVLVPLGGPPGETTRN